MTPLLHDSPASPLSPPRYRAWHACIAIAWAAAVVGGLAAVARHGYAPGRASATTEWPLGDRLQLDPARPTLVMSLHAQCPCSRASVAELGELLAAHPGALRSIVLIDNPIASMSAADGPLWRLASTLPGVELIDDVGGQLALRLDAETSGQTFLFDPSGNLRFSGGVTASRGHVGPNDGVAAVESILAEKVANESGPSTLATPVFGCDMR